MKAWVTQLARQVRTLGADKAPWYVEWLDPAGKKRCKSCGPGSEGKKSAGKLRRKVEAQLIEGTYDDASKRTWAEFREQYDSRVLEGMDPGTRAATRVVLDHFERVIHPVRMVGITSKTIADYVAKRRKANGRGERLLSKATINKELRHLRAILRKAHRWGYLSRVPEFEFLKCVKKLPTYMPPEHFAKVYRTCDAATQPKDLPNVPAPDWWRALLMFAYTTGWRIGQILALKWADVDLEEGTAITRGDANKGRRNQKIALADVTVEHLRKIKASFDSHVFPWNHRGRTLWLEFQAIQEAAAVARDGPIKTYGFHDLRRAFATLNEDRLTPLELQAMMQHQSFETTKGYINMARRLKVTASKVYVPDTDADPSS